MTMTQYAVTNGGKPQFYGSDDECLQYIINETEGTSEFLLDEDYTTLTDGGEVHGYQIIELTFPGEMTAFCHSCGSITPHGSTIQKDVIQCAVCDTRQAVKHEVEETV